MGKSITADNFHGIDWHTTQASLARVLTTLDTMQTLVLGFMSELELGEADQLKLLAELACEARAELDFLAADSVGRYPASSNQLQAMWSLVEVNELMAAMRDLANEARAAMRHQHLDDMPDTVTLDLSENLRRIKLLLASFDDTPAMMLASA